MNLDQATDALADLLNEHYNNMVNDVQQEDAAVLQAIAQDAATYGISYARGDEHAAANLRHLEAQVELLAAKVAARENRRIGETLLKVASVAGQMLGVFLHRIPLV